MCDYYLLTAQKTNINNYAQYVLTLLYSPRLTLVCSFLDRASDQTDSDHQTLASLINCCIV